MLQQKIILKTLGKVYSRDPEMWLSTRDIAIKTAIPSTSVVNIMQRLREDERVAYRPRHPDGAQVNGWEYQARDVR